MDESFLHFVWKYQRFNAIDLKTTDGQDIIVFRPGNHNHDSGPDFEEARVKLEKLEWSGSIEIHIKSSDWVRHNHSEDKAYKNVILHVVWEHDHELFIDHELIPTLELKNLVDSKLVSEYQKHIEEKDPIACASQFSSKLEMPYLAMIEGVLVERLEQKAAEILKILQETHNDWDEVFYRLLVTNFGFYTNKLVFRQLTQKLPFATLKKNLSDLTKLEALFFGQAGFLDNPVDQYQGKLREEFNYLKSKHNLPPAIQKHEWKFGKMRPANFPSLRIAQISNLFYSQPRIFINLIESEDINKIFSLLRFKLSPYWNSRYDFGKTRKPPKNTIGIKSIENIAINTMAPILAAYSKYMKDPYYMDRAIDLLEKIPPEDNRITKEWKRIGKTPKNAMDSQAQIQLYREYCNKRKCLSCSVGVTLLDK